MLFQLMGHAMPSTLAHSLRPVAAAADKAGGARCAISRVQRHSCLHAWLTLRRVVSVLSLKPRLYHYYAQNPKPLLLSPLPILDGCVCLSQYEGLGFSV